MKVKNIVLIGMMAAILLSIQVALRFLPNIELVSIIVILSTIVFGWRTLFIIYTFVFAEIFIYGPGLWSINYLYVWTVLMFATWLFKSNKSSYFWAIFAGAFGLCFGALCAVPYFFMGGLPTAVAYWTSGIPFDIIHCISNFVITLTLFRPLLHLFNKIKHYLI